jgi:hypothetical protein
MTPPNTTGRGHPPRVGGPQSKGTVQKAVRVSKEMWAALIAGKGKNFDFSGYVRGLIKRDIQI